MATIEGKLSNYRDDLNKFINEYDSNEYENRKYVTEETDTKLFKVREHILLIPSQIMSILTMREKVKKIKYTDTQINQLGELKIKFNEMRKSRKLVIPHIDQHGKEHDQWTKKEHIDIADEVAINLIGLIDEILENT